MSRNVGFSTTFGIRNEVPSVCFCLFLMSFADQSSFPPVSSFMYKIALENYTVKFPVKEKYRESMKHYNSTLEFSICTKH